MFHEFLKEPIRPSAGVRCSILCFGFIIISSACSVDIPEGVIACNGVYDTESCPTGWVCRSDNFCYSSSLLLNTDVVQMEDPMMAAVDASVAIVDSSTSLDSNTPFPVSDSSEIALVESECEAATKSCEAECGVIYDECGRTIECGECPIDKTCVNNVCVSECGGCLIDGDCYKPGTLNPQNACEVCKPMVSTSAWSGNDGMLCDDGKYCTISDKCIGTICRGQNRNCDDGIKCNGRETCSETVKNCVSGASTCQANQFCDSSTDQCVTSCQDCTIGQTCFPNGTRNPINECQICDTSQDAMSWVIAIGVECGEAATECSAQDTCDNLGNCVPNHLEGTPCGSGPTDCSGQDTCDGNGNCIPNHFGTNQTCGTLRECEDPDFCNGEGICVDTLELWVAGRACGSSETTACSARDTCDWFGVCQPNHMGPTTPCGPAPSDWECSHQDYCDSWGGNCIDSGDPPNGTPCNEGAECQEYQCHAGNCMLVRNLPSTTECGHNEPAQCWAHEHCNGQGRCVAGEALSNVPCGSNRGTVCSGPDICINGVCDPNHNNSQTECGAAIDPECDESDFCDGNGSCVPSNPNDFNGDPCTGGSPLDNQCLRYGCNGGTCIILPNQGVACTVDNPDQCVASYVCDDQGNCIVDEYSDEATNCNDDNVCTTADHCTGYGGCVSSTYATDNVGCDDGNVNTTDDHCDGLGHCIGSLPGVDAGAG